MRYLFQVLRQIKYRFILYFIIASFSLLCFFLTDDFKYHLNSEIAYINGKIVELNYKSLLTSNDYIQLSNLRSKKALLVPISSFLGSEISLYAIPIALFLSLSLLIFEKMFFRSHKVFSEYFQNFFCGFTKIYSF